MNAKHIVTVGCTSHHYS